MFEIYRGGRDIGGGTGLLKESLYIDDQQCYHYQQSDQTPLTSIHWIQKTTICYIAHPQRDYVSPQLMLT